MDAPWFDRQEILAPLVRRIEGFLAGYRQNCALLGPEAIGKTTLLKRLIQQRLSPSSSLVSFYLEVRKDESLAEWAARFVQTLLYGALQAKGIHDLPTDLSSLEKLSSSVIPKTSALASQLLGLSEAGRNEEVYPQLWDLPHLMTRETGIPCLLVLDEFHQLQGLEVKDPFRRLGQKIMVQNTTMFLVASSQPLVARRILREGLNLLFGQFEILELSPLDAPICLKAIRAVWPTAQADPFLEHLLIELAQGYPVYLDLLLQGLMNRRLPEATGFEDRTLLDLLESLLLEEDGALRQRLELRIRRLAPHRNRRTWIRVLAAVAAGNHRVPQIAHALECSPPQVLGALKVLEPVELVTKQGVFYRVPDRLLQLWMLTAHPILQGAALADSALARARFRDAAWAWIEKIRQEVHRPIEEQIKALLHQWAGELVEIEGRRVLLPAWDRVEQVPGPGKRPATMAHPSGKTGKGWLVIPWAGPLEEGQAREMVQEISKLPLKVHRKILLGPHPVELNARLILQEARVRLWDLHVLNHLLDLYGLARLPFPLEEPSCLGEAIPIFSELAPVSADLQAKPAT